MNINKIETDMDISPNTERLISTIFIITNVTAILKSKSEYFSTVAIFLAAIISIVASSLLLTHESDFQSVRLACCILPLAAAATMPKRDPHQRRNTQRSFPKTFQETKQDGRRILEAFMMALPLTMAIARVRMTNVD